MGTHIDSSVNQNAMARIYLAHPLELNSYSAAHKFMLDALLSVQENLPEPAREAISLSRHFAEKEVDPQAEEHMRMKLWKSISGREMEDSQEVLGIRATICILFLGSDEPPSPADVLEFFLDVFNAAKFPQYCPLLN